MLYNARKRIHNVCTAAEARMQVPNSDRPSSAGAPAARAARVSTPPSVPKVIPFRAAKLVKIVTVAPRSTHNTRSSLLHSGLQTEKNAIDAANHARAAAVLAATSCHQVPATDDIGACSQSVKSPTRRCTFPEGQSTSPQCLAMAEYGCMCPQHTSEAQGLEVRNTHIGTAVFATRSFADGERVGIYSGYRINVKKGSAILRGKFMVEIDRTTYINA